GNLFVATVNGDLRLNGDLAGSSQLSGTVRIERADITIPESFGGAAAAVVDTDHRNIPPGAATTLARAKVDQRGRTPRGAPSSSIGLDVTVSAPNQIFVRGRGLDAEVGGNV